MGYVTVTLTDNADLDLVASQKGLLGASGSCRARLNESDLLANAIFNTENAQRAVTVDLAAARSG